MIMDILYRHLAVLLVFLTLAGVTWINGGARPAPLISIMPWLMALSLEGFLFFPQRRPYEDMIQARSRVWTSLRRDLLLYVILAFLLLLIVPFFNRALCPNCDCVAIAAGAEPGPPASFLPFCVNVQEHLGVMTWFVPAFLTALAVRHALTREGKRVFLEMAVWNGAALAIFGFIEQATGATFVFWEKIEHPVYFFSVFGYPNAAGAFFTMLFAFSIGLWRYHAKETVFLREANKGRHTVGQTTWWLRANYPLVATVLLLFAVLYTRSRAAILLTSILMAIAVAYVVLDVLGDHSVKRASRLKSVIVSFIGIVVIGVTVMIFAPKEISAEMKTADLAAIADRVTGKTEWHVDAALALFKEYPVFGIGGWGYRHLCLPYVPPRARREFGKWYSRGGANVHNDYLQFLCEHGAVGAGLLLIMLIMLAWPTCVVWSRLYRASRFVRADKSPPKPRAIFVLPAAAFWIFAGCVCLLIHAFGDCPLRGAAVMTMLFSALPAAEGFVPRRDEIELADSGGKEGHSA